jgi:hypothetical protein
MHTNTIPLKINKEADRIRIGRTVSRRFSLANIQCTLLACVRGVHKHWLMYHGCVRSKSQALVLQCVRLSFIARLGSWFDYVRRSFLLSAVPTVILCVKNLPEASWHNFLA